MFSLALGINVGDSMYRFSALIINITTYNINQATFALYCVFGNQDP